MWKRLAEKGQAIRTEKGRYLKKLKGKDRFGCMHGMPPARINSLLSTIPKTPEGLQGNDLKVNKVKAHLRYWIKKGTGLGAFLIETRDGKYAISDKPVDRDNTTDKPVTGDRTTEESIAKDRFGNRIGSMRPRSTPSCPSNRRRFIRSPKNPGWSSGKPMATK